MLRCGFAYSMETTASSVCRMFLNARQDIEGCARACAVPSGFQAHTHDAVKGSIRSIRPGYGSKPNEVNSMINKTLIRDVIFGEPARQDVVK